MLKVGLPKAAVVHACQRDNVDPAIILDGDTSASTSISNDEQQMSCVLTDTHRRTRLVSISKIVKSLPYLTIGNTFLLVPHPSDF